MKSKNPRKQRKSYYNAPLHKKRKMLSAHLAENLLLKYDRRSTTIVKGDSVKVMRGSFKGHEDKISSVNLHKQIVEVEGITTVKADGTKVAKPIHASNLLITKLNLTDKWRRKKLEKGLSEETKKEIEEEAKEQIKEIEKLKEEERIAEAEIEEDTELAEKETVEGDIKKPEKIKEPTKKKDKVISEEVSDKPKNKISSKKKETKKEKKVIDKKKTPPKKKSEGKTTKKTTKKVEGKNE
jgi:large subunit ribosomal protein L24